jgi:GT2 family glycosyltransferase/methylase of polypeptide subunit release factors
MSIKSGKNHGRSIRLAALVVAFIFTATSVTWTTPPLAVAADAVPSVIASITTLSIPAEMGTITREYGVRSSEFGENAKPGTPYASRRTVVLIQDAHAVIDAQENIGKILGHLRKNYGIALTALEGAKGRLEPILLRTFPEAIVKRKILAGYENRAELSGPEMAAVLQEEEGEFLGMEDWGLYEQNYSAYLRAQDKKDGLLKKWSRFKETLDSQRAKVYDAKLMEFQEIRENFLSERASLLDLLMYLANFQGLLKTSSGYQELPGLITSIGYEKSGKQDALIPLVRKIADEFKVKYLRGLGVKTEMNFYNRYQAFMTGQITAGQMLQYLVQVGRDNGKSIRLTPDLKRLLGHAELLSEVKGSRLYDELQRFLTGVEASLITSPAQRELAEKYQKLFLLKEMIELELPHEGLAAYQKDPNAYLDLIGESSFKEDLLPALEFYQAALGRDQAFMGKIDAMMKNADQKTVAVVAGGFHTNGLERILQEKGMAYAVVTPKMASLAGLENYAKVMKGDVSFKGDLRTTYFDALMRHTAKAMIEALPIPDRVRTLKAWRDNVIRELAKQGRIAEAGKYLPYIDEILQRMPEAVSAVGPKQTKEEILDMVRKELEKFKTDSLGRIWKTLEFQLGALAEGLKQLVTRKELNDQSVSSLLERASGAKPSMLSALRALDPSAQLAKDLASIKVPDIFGTHENIVEALVGSQKLPAEPAAAINGLAQKFVDMGVKTKEVLAQRPNEVRPMSVSDIQKALEPVVREVTEKTGLSPQQARLEIAGAMNRIAKERGIATAASDVITQPQAATDVETEKPAGTRRSETRAEEGAVELQDLSQIEDRNLRLSLLGDQVTALMGEWERTKDVNRDENVYRHVARRLFFQGSWLTDEKIKAKALEDDLASLTTPDGIYVSKEFGELVNEANAVETPGTPSKVFAGTPASAKPATPGEANRSEVRGGDRGWTPSGDRPHVNPHAAIFDAKAGTTAAQLAGVPTRAVVQPKVPAAPSRSLLDRVRRFTQIAGLRIALQLPVVGALAFSAGCEEIPELIGSQESRETVAVSAESLLNRSSLNEESFYKVSNAYPHIAQSFKGMTYEEFIAHAPSAAEQKLVSDLLTYGRAAVSGFDSRFQGLSIVILTGSPHDSSDGYGVHLGSKQTPRGVIVFDFKDGIPTITSENWANMVEWAVHEAAHAGKNANEPQARQEGIDFVVNAGLDQADTFFKEWVNEEQFMVDAANLENQGEGDIWDYYWANGGTREWALAPYYGAKILAPNGVYQEVEKNNDGSFTIRLVDASGTVSFNYRREGEGWTMEGSDQGPLTINPGPVFILNGQTLQMQMQLVESRSELRGETKPEVVMPSSAHRARMEATIASRAGEMSRRGLLGRIFSIFAIGAAFKNIASPSVTLEERRQAEMSRRSFFRVAAGGVAIALGVTACEPVGREEGQVGFRPFDESIVPSGYRKVSEAGASDRNLIEQAWNELRARQKNGYNPGVENDIDAYLFDPDWQNYVYINPDVEGRAEGGAGGLAYENFVTVDESTLEWVRTGGEEAWGMFVETLIHELVHFRHTQRGTYGGASGTSLEEENVTRVETAQYFGDSFYFYDPSQRTDGNPGVSYYAPPYETLPNIRGRSDVTVFGASASGMIGVSTELPQDVMDYAIRDARSRSELRTVKNVSAPAAGSRARMADVLRRVLDSRRLIIGLFFGAVFSVVGTIMVLAAFVVDWHATPVIAGILHVLVSGAIFANSAETIVGALFTFLFKAIKGPMEYKEMLMPHGIPDQHKTLLAYMLLSSDAEISRETLQNMFNAYMNNLDPNGNVTAVLVSASTRLSVVKAEMDLRDHFRDLIRTTMTEEAEQLLSLKGEGRWRVFGNNPRLSFWKELFEGWEAEGLERDVLRAAINAKIEQAVRNFKYLHRTTRVLKKPGQYQDLFVLASRGIEIPYTYIDERYGEDRREPGLRMFGFERGKNIENDLGLDAEQETALLHDLEMRGRGDVTDLMNEGLKYQAKESRHYFKYTITCDQDNTVPPGAVRQLVQIAAANPDRGVLQPAVTPDKIETWTQWREALSHQWAKQLPEGFFRTFGRFGDYGKGLKNNDIYIDRIIGTPENPIEALQINKNSHDTWEGLFENPMYVPKVVFGEDANRNYISKMEQQRRWKPGDMQNGIDLEPRAQPLFSALRRIYTAMTGIEIKEPWVRPNDFKPSAIARYIAHFPTRTMLTTPLLAFWIFFNPIAIQAGWLVFKYPLLQLISFLFVFKLLTVMPKMYNPMLNFFSGIKTLRMGEWSSAKANFRLAFRGVNAGLLEILTSPFNYMPELLISTVEIGRALFVWVIDKNPWKKSHAEMVAILNNLDFGTILRYTWYVPVTALLILGASAITGFVLHPLTLFMLGTWLVDPLTTWIGGRTISEGARKTLIYRLAEKREQKTGEPATARSEMREEPLRVIQTLQTNFNEKNKRIWAETGLPKISIVVLNYNGAEYLKKMLETLSAADHSNFVYELIVIDNGSIPEDFQKVTEAAGTIEQPATVFRLDRNAGGIARNLGIEKALAHGSDYVLFLDNDILFSDSKALTTLVRRAQGSRDSKEMAFGPTLYLAGSPGKIWSNGAHFPGTNDEKSYTDEKEVDYFPTAATLVRSRAFREVGGFDPRFFIYYDDTDWFMRLGDLGFKSILVPQAEMDHVNGAGMGLGKSNLQRLYHGSRGRMLMMKKYGMLSDPKEFVMVLLSIGKAIAKTAVGILTRTDTNGPRAALRGYYDGLTEKHLPYVRPQEKQISEPAGSQAYGLPQLQPESRSEVRSADQKILMEATDRFGDERLEFVKKSVVGFVIPKGEWDAIWEGIPEGIRTHLGEKDETYRTNLRKILTENQGGFIVLQPGEEGKLDFYVVGASVAEKTYVNKVAVGLGSYQKLVRASKPGIVKMVRMSDLKNDRGEQMFPVDEPAEIDVNWGTLENPIPDKQRKPANRDAYLAWDGKQWYMINADAQGLPANYMPASPVLATSVDIEGMAQGLFADVARQGKLSVEDRQLLDTVLQLAKAAHSAQLRDEGEPYFVHPLDVARFALERFGVASAVAIAVYLLHDTREDQGEFYKAIKDILEDMFQKLEATSKDASGDQRRKYNLIRLGVKIMTNIEPVYNPKTGQWEVEYNYDGKKRIDAFAVETEAQKAATRIYYDRFVNPYRYFQKDKTDGGSYYSPFTEKDIDEWQEGKVADRVKNILGLIRLAGKSVLQTEKTRQKPAKTIQKTLNEYIHYFIEAGNPENSVEEAQATPERPVPVRLKAVFYQSTIEILLEYATLDDMPDLQAASLAALRDAEFYRYASPHLAPWVLDQWNAVRSEVRGTPEIVEQEAGREDQGSRHPFQFEIIRWMEAVFKPGAREGVKSELAVEKDGSILLPEVARKSLKGQALILSSMAGDVVLNREGAIAYRVENLNREMVTKIRDRYGDQKFVWQWGGFKKEVTVGSIPTFILRGLLRAGQDFGILEVKTYQEFLKFFVRGEQNLKLRLGKNGRLILPPAYLKERPDLQKVSFVDRGNYYQIITVTGPEDEADSQKTTAPPEVPLENLEEIRKTGGPAWSSRELSFFGKDLKDNGLVVGAQIKGLNPSEGVGRISQVFRAKEGGETVPDQIFKIDRGRNILDELEALSALHAAGVTGIPTEVVGVGRMQDPDNRFWMQTRGIPKALSLSPKNWAYFKLPEGDVLDVWGKVASIFEAMHRAGWNHNDIKMANILINREGAVEVIDFGLARPLNTRLGSAGTPGYKAPESVKTAASDVFGIVISVAEFLYRMAQELPEEKRGYQQFLSGLVDQYLDQIFSKHPSADKLLQDPAQIVTGLEEKIDATPVHLFDSHPELYELRPVAERPSLEVVIAGLQKDSARLKNFLSPKSDQEAAVGARSETRVQELQMDPALKAWLKDFRKQLAGLGVLSDSVLYPNTDAAYQMVRDGLLPAIKPGSRIVEVGVGSGVIISMLAEAARDISGVRLQGTDIDPEAVAVTRQMLQRFGFKNIGVRQGDLLNTLEPGDQVDIIVWNPPWFSDQWNEKTYGPTMVDKDYKTVLRFLDEARDHLKPGGRIFLLFPVNYFQKDIQPKISYRFNLSQSYTNGKGLEVGLFEYDPMASRRDRFSTEPKVKKNVDTRERDQGKARSEIRGVPSFAEVLSHNKGILSDPRQWELSELDRKFYTQMSQWDAEKLGIEFRKFFQEGVLVPINDTSLLKVKGGEDFLRKFINHLINGSDSLREISSGKMGREMSHYWSPAEISSKSILGMSLMSKYSESKFQEYRSRYRVFLIRLVDYWDGLSAAKGAQKMPGVEGTAKGKAAKQSSSPRRAEVRIEPLKLESGQHYAIDLTTGKSKVITPDQWPMGVKEIKVGQPFVRNLSSRDEAIRLDLNYCTALLFITSGSVKGRHSFFEDLGQLRKDVDGMPAGLKKDMQAVLIGGTDYQGSAPAAEIAEGRKDLMEQMQNDFGSGVTQLIPDAPDSVVGVVIDPVSNTLFIRTVVRAEIRSSVPENRRRVVELLNSGLKDLKNAVGVHGTSIEAIMKMIETGRLPDTGRTPGQFFFYPTGVANSNPVDDATTYSLSNAATHYVVAKLKSAGIELTNDELEELFLYVNFINASRANYQGLFKKLDAKGVSERKLDQWIKDATKKEGRGGVLLLLSKDIEKDGFEVMEGESAVDTERFINIRGGFPLKYIVGIVPVGDYEKGKFEQLRQAVEALSPDAGTRPSEKARAEVRVKLGGLMDLSSVNVVQGVQKAGSVEKYRAELRGQAANRRAGIERTIDERIETFRDELGELGTVREVVSFILSSKFQERLTTLFGEFGDVTELVSRIRNRIVLGEESVRSDRLADKASQLDIAKIAKDQALLDIVAAGLVMNGKEPAFVLLMDRPGDGIAEEVLSMLTTLKPSRLIVYNAPGEKPFGRAWQSRLSGTIMPVGNEAAVRRAVKASSDLVVSFWTKERGMEGLGIYSILAEVGRIADPRLRELALTAVRIAILRFATLEPAKQSEILAKPALIRGYLEQFGIPAFIEFNSKGLVFNIERLVEEYTARQSVAQSA